MAAPDQEALLLVQAADTSADQLRHRRSHLPERVAVAEAEAAAVAAKRAGEVRAARLAELAGRQASLEAELAATEARATSVEARLRSGEVTAARDVVRFGEEVAHLRERAATFEDQAFEALVEREAAEAEVAEADERLAAAVASLRQSRADLSGAEEELDVDLAGVEAVRAAQAAEVSPALLARYDKLRAHLGGTGAARLADGRCQGCHLALSPRDLDDARRAPEEEVLTCDACGRILVRV